MNRVQGNNGWVGLLALIGLALVWQLASMLVTVEITPGVPMVPGWQVVLTSTFVSMSNFWMGGFGIPAASAGTEPSYGVALLSVLFNSLDTFRRLLLGCFIGGGLGFILGLLLSLSQWTNRLVGPTMRFVRTLPLLAMIPLFQLWFGIADFGMVTFIAYGVGVILFTSVLNAVPRIAPIYLANARCLGASPWRLFRTVTIPAILPEVRSAAVIAMGVAWAAALGAEYLGAQSGLGRIVVASEAFGYLDRMFLTAVIIVLYAAGSTYLLDRAFARVLQWG
ncbi:ABC transporter permease [Devosia sp. RR2S18]|uniref:ABC transporter permease n=1 Tax=Devosia rhizosphaerae TaxID=3049774 RepID=UPI0025402886|nr:ABC transporter permease subunit [Devosia sp. RR2S18]WIJ25818.1 ABC transporter permease subunit [Devosia sp. RR2S18]